MNQELCDLIKHCISYIILFYIMVTNGFIWQPRRLCMGGSHGVWGCSVQQVSGAGVMGEEVLLVDLSSRDTENNG